MEVRAIRLDICLLQFLGLKAVLLSFDFHLTVHDRPNFPPFDKNQDLPLVNCFT